MADGFVEYLVKYNTTKAEKNLKSFDKTLGKVDSAVKKVAKAAIAGFAAMATGAGVFLKKVIETAAEVEEMENKFNVVFDGMTDDVDKWAKDFSKSVGRSSNDIKGYLANLADLQIGMGQSQEAAADFSKDVVTLALDLASFNNVNDATAIEAVSKAMMGEAEMAKQLGLLLNVDRVKEYAEAQGLVYEELTDAERSQLTYALAVEQSQNAIGDAERSAGSFTNQIKALKGNITDFLAAAGAPLLENAAAIVSQISDWVSSNHELGASIAQNITDKVTAAIDKIKALKDTVVAWYNDNKPKIEEIAGVFISAKDTILEALDPIISKVKTFSEENDLLTLALDGVLTVVSAVATGFALVATALLAFSNWIQEHQTLVEVLAIVIGSLAAAIVFIT